MRDHACSRQPAQTTRGGEGRGERKRAKEQKKKKTETCLVQRLIVNTRAKHLDGDGPTLTLQLARAALEYRRLVPRDEVHLVHEQKHGRLWRVLLQTVETVTVVLCVLCRISCADLKNVNEHADVLEDGRSLSGQV
jgi:hypothetical protein